MTVATDCAWHERGCRVKMASNFTLESAVKHGPGNCIRMHPTPEQLEVYSITSLRVCSWLQIMGV